MRALLRRKQVSGPVNPGPPVHGARVDVEIDGPEADAEVARFASTLTAIRGRLLIFRALVQTLPTWTTLAPHLGWQGLSDRLRLCDVPASHLGLMQAPHVQVVADVLAEQMAAHEAGGEKPAARAASSG